jgi:hypothetical protein
MRLYSTHATIMLLPTAAAAGQQSAALSTDMLECTLMATSTNQQAINNHYTVAQQATRQLASNLSKAANNYSCVTAGCAAGICSSPLQQHSQTVASTRRMHRVAHACMCNHATAKGPPLQTCTFHASPTSNTPTLHEGQQAFCQLTCSS